MALAVIYLSTWTLTMASHAKRPISSSGARNGQNVAKKAKAQGGVCIPDWLSVESLKPELEKLRVLKVSRLTTKEFIGTVQSIKSNIFALEIFKDMVLSISCGLTADYNGFAVNDPIDGVGASDVRLVRDVLAALSEDENTRDSALVLSFGIAGKDWNDAIDTLFYHQKCCKGMGTGYLEIAKFTKLGGHLISKPRGKRSAKKYDDLLASIPLLRALWEAPFLSAIGHVSNFEQVHQAYNALLTKYPAAYRIMDPSIVIIEGNDAGMAADVAAMPVGVVAGGLNAVTLGAMPALHGNMTRVYSVADIGEARTLIAFLKGRNNAYNMIGVSTAAGNFVAG